MLRREATSRISSIITLVLASIAAIFSTIVFLIDVSLVAIARNKLKDHTDNLTLNWGNAVCRLFGVDALKYELIVPRRFG